MSVWSSINGYVSVNADSHISVRTVFDEVMGVVEYVLTCEKVVHPSHDKNFYKYKITCSYCMENDHAMKIAERLIKKLKELGFHIDLEVTVRYIVC